MFGRWFNPKKQTSSRAGADAAPSLNAMEMDLAIEFLQNAHTPLPLSHADAQLVARHFQPRRYIADEVLIRAGDTRNTDYMLWILEGQALIEASTRIPQNPVTMTVLEPGSTVGEMGLLDGQARSATCTACSAMRCAVLTRESLLSLSARHPEIAVKLMFVIALSVTVRLRDATEKFRRYVLMANAIRDELMGSSLPVPLASRRNNPTSAAPEHPQAVKSAHAVTADSAGDSAYPAATARAR